MITSISVVIPVKDDASLLLRCLEALHPQLADVDELFVVDNGSTDESAAVARQFGATVIEVSGGGIPAASAAGYDVASGSVIARLDADCVPGADWLTVIRREFTARPSVAAVTGMARFIDGPRPLRGILAALYLGSYFATLYPALSRPPIFGSNCAFRHSVWQEVRGAVHRHDPRVHDDLDLSFHLAPLHRVRFSRRLTMGMSMRPLFRGAAFAVRLRRGMYTVVIHWPDDWPWLRWSRRVVSILR